MEGQVSGSNRPKTKRPGCISTYVLLSDIALYFSESNYRRLDHHMLKCSVGYILEVRSKYVGYPAYQTSDLVRFFCGLLLIAVDVCFKLPWPVRKYITISGTCPGCNAIST